MGLEQQVRALFSPQGLLAHSVAGFVARAGQAEMAAAVARTIASGGVLAVEAGTGIGKTFAYLVPALLSGSRVLVSTATKALQDQLYQRDLPGLIGVLGIPLRMALLKGRSSYLCLYRLGHARHDSDSAPRRLLADLARVEQWAQVTQSGDLAEIDGLDERSAVIPHVTSTRDNCLGSQCPQFRACHVQLARREALAADLVVVNHHLFFADVAVREAGVAELLPSVHTLIFDEAHQLNETGVQFLGRQLSSAQLLDFARDLRMAGLMLARGFADWTRLAAGIEYAARDLRLLWGVADSGSRVAWTEPTPAGVEAAAWLAGLAAWERACRLALESLELVCDSAPELARLHQRLESIIEHLAFFNAPADPQAVRWLDVGAQIAMVEAPLDISKALQTQMPPGVEGDAPQRAWIFTSATLGEDAQLRWFTQSCGLAGAEILKIGSPFDYARQARLYVPGTMVKPGDLRHSGEVADLVARAAARIGGRTLVLTTTLRALRTIGEALRTHFADPLGLEVLVQGQLPKRELMERMHMANRDGRPGCVLVASASFWEGVDIAGDALQLVVIDKLPFPPPHDPLVQARAKVLEAAGRNVFVDYFLAEAAVSLKQGAGRLIRRESDRGILVVCDTRLVRQGYGRRLLRALPPMHPIHTQDAFDQALEALTRPSTTDPNWP